MCIGSPHSNILSIWVPQHQILLQVSIQKLSNGGSHIRQSVLRVLLGTQFFPLSRLSISFFYRVSFFVFFIFPHCPKSRQDHSPTSCFRDDTFSSSLPLLSSRMPDFSSIFRLIFPLISSQQTGLQHEYVVF